MRLGIFCRTAERTLDGQRVGFRRLRDLTLAAETAGLDSFWLPDHLVFRPGEPEQIGCWETFTLLGALAAATTRIQLGSFVAATTFRNPALLAKMAASLDEISGGRFMLGVGAGNWEAEHAAFGYPFDHRAGRFEEAIRILAPLLRRGAVDFHGRYHEAHDCVLSPQGPSPNGPPILVGARGDRMLRIAARHADGVIVIWPASQPQVREQRGRLDAACRAVGRDPGTLALVAGTFVHLTDTTPEPDERSIGGSEEAIAATVRSFAAAGVDHLVVDPRPDITAQTIAALGRVRNLLGTVG